MTLTVTLEFSPEMEARLRAGIARGDSEDVRQVLTDALSPAVDSLVSQMPAPLDEDAFERIANQIADGLENNLDADTPLLSDEAVSRTGIYEGHFQG